MRRILLLLSGTHVKHRLAAFAFGILIVLVYATGAELRTTSTDWTAPARAGLAAGLAWLLIVPLVVAADRRLPIARDVLLPRLLMHVPLSVAVSWAFAYLYYALSRVLHAPIAPETLAAAPLSAFHRFTWLVYWAIIGWYVASDYQDQIRDRKVRTAEHYGCPGQPAIREGRFSGIFTPWGIIWLQLPRGGGKYVSDQATSAQTLRRPRCGPLATA